MREPVDVDRVGLAELIGALSLGIDLGFGQPMEHVLRQCWIALRLAEHLGFDEEQRSVVYYTALLTNVGCHTDAHEQAKWFGDDIALKGDKYVHGLHGVRSAVAGLRRLGAGQPVLQRFRVGLNFALSGYKELDEMVAGHSAMARSLAAEIGLPVAVQEAVGASYEQWDGKGWPGELAGEAVPIAARVSQLAEFVDVAHRSGGIEAAVALARKLAGSQFDPNIAARFASASGDILDGLGDASTWDQVIAADPVLGRPLRGEQLDEALGAVADFIDLKSPYTLGHARGVAELVTAAATQLKLGSDEVRTLRRAGLVHGLGRLGISNAIWDKRGPLGPGEWERVRLQPYLTDRMLQRHPPWRRSVRLRHCCASGWTAPGIHAVCPGRPSGCRRASWVPPTPTRRWSSRGPIGPLASATGPPPSCGPKSALVVSTAMPPKESWSRQVIAPGRAASGRPG